MSQELVDNEARDLRDNDRLFESKTEDSQETG